MDSSEWARVMIAVGIFVAMFAFPILSIAHDERKKRRNGERPEPTGEL